MIVVFGSINVDLAARVARLPRIGETLAGQTFSMLAGGKGANQALAARRAGARVNLFGCTGRDAMAAVALRDLQRADVDLAGVRPCDASTGVALIHVDDAGDNCITVVPGANAEARAGQVPDALLTADTTVLMQLEVPIDEVAALARRARRREARVVLNAAPALALPAGLLEDVDVLVVNEAEATTLAGGVDACLLLATDDRAVVVTRGADGAIWARDGDVRAQAAPRVDVVDSVGAGDAFSAALAAALDRGDDFARGMREGVAAGALACLRAGAQDALPLRDAIVRMASTLPLADRFE